MIVPPRLASPPVELASAGDRAEIIDVLCSAFRDYPVMRYVLGRSSRRYESNLRTLIEMFVMARVLRSETMLIVRGPMGAGGAALMSDPLGPPAPAEFEELRERVWRKLGAAARRRYEECGAVWAAFAFPSRHLHLNMIGVRPELQGSGLSRRLLEEVHRRALEWPGCSGVSLTTEKPGNVGLYEHFGYAVVANGRIAPGVETWGLFRPNRMDGSATA